MIYVHRPCQLCCAAAKCQLHLQGALKNALALKDKIDSAEAKELMLSGNLIAEHCVLTEESLR